MEGVRTISPPDSKFSRKLGLPKYYYLAIFAVQF